MRSERPVWSGRARRIVRISDRNARLSSMGRGTEPQRTVVLVTGPETNRAFDAKQFRSVLGHFPTGVTIVSGIAEGAPFGFTIGSFTSVSLDPPMVGFLPMISSDTWAAISPSGSFCVNVLSREQADLCWRFAKTGNEHERFDGVAWHAGPTGSPIIDRAVAWIDCETEAVYEMGDHLFVLGRVVALEADADHDGDGPHPLLFFKGTLGGFAAEG
jgi:flavin reductase (DIM6/NTAB) family NADH-FMN oxidoreductase RutF